ncbi:MAG: hypothetical protein QG656_1866, partial [Candidatus Hydrogenedentes bacterium]|nr:hypothetical protein [Candidatus Hydrogenedentota bacterium]
MSTYYEQPQYRFQRERLTFAVQRLILINVAVYAFQLLVDIPFGYPVVPGSHTAPPGGKLFLEMLTFQPRYFLSGCLWQPLTYQFLHSGLMHLFMNMLWLFFFGPQVERTLGTRQFFLIYFVCGAGAVLFTLLSLFLFGRDPSVAGASGAVMAVLMAYVVIDPRRQFFLFPLPVPIPAWVLVCGVIVMNVVWGIQGDRSVSVSTHLGGLGLGYVYIKAIPLLRRWKIDRRRRAFDARKDGDVDIDG